MKIRMSGDLFTEIFSQRKVHKTRRETLVVEARRKGCDFLSWGKELKSPSRVDDGVDPKHKIIQEMIWFDPLSCPNPQGGLFCNEPVAGGTAGSISQEGLTNSDSSDEYKHG